MSSMARTHGADQFGSVHEGLLQRDARVLEEINHLELFFSQQQEALARMLVPAKSHCISCA